MSHLQPSLKGIWSLDVFHANSNESTGLVHRNKRFVPHKDGNVKEASVSLQAGNERLVATIAAYFAAIVGLCGRSPNCPRLNATYAFNRGYQKCPNSSPALKRGAKGNGQIFVSAKDRSLHNLACHCR